MTEQELRALVRDAIARHAATAGSGGADHYGPAARPADPAQSSAPCPTHPSFAMFSIPSGADADGPCFIEPTVLCTHCGYCKSFGH